ncbi:MAG TPA: metallophosphoesterase [Mycobacteriales bacterium]|nr:metallophosphoesterase [Mycobacteriales bacterium]
MDVRRIAAPVAGLVAASAATLAYAGLVERNVFRLRRFDVPVLAADAAPLRVLHLSDLHLTTGQRRKRAWIAGLDRLQPDLVVVTGDFLAGVDTVGPVLAALEPLLERPGAFVPGNNDYYAPVPKNPLRYFMPERQPTFGAALPWSDLADAMVAAGWVDATHRRATVKADGREVALAGTDDPHLRRDRYRMIAGPADPSADVRIGLTHSPEPRVVSAFAADGYELVLAGHTHGGQLRVPGLGAIVTNCGIDRPRARWLHRWDDHTWLHVSAGLGTSPYAPVRFACPPEATLLTLVPRLR